jgi:threonine/homoserine/homoserine lactone efflux protein
MSELQPILVAALAGFVTALVFSSIPVGPINLTIINEGAQRGFKWALLIGLGASVMEGIYCSIAFTGFSSFFGIHLVKASMEVVSFVFLLFIGGKFLMAQTVDVRIKLDTASKKIEARLDQKLHPHSAFMTGFVRVMGNLGVLLTWIVLAAYLMAHGASFLSQNWVADSLAAKAACIGGVLLGTNTWFLTLCFSVSRGHGRFSKRTLLRMQHVSGFCLLRAGLYAGAHIIWQLAKHKM